MKLNNEKEQKLWKLHLKKTYKKIVIHNQENEFKNNGKSKVMKRYKKNWKKDMKSYKKYQPMYMYVPCKKDEIGMLYVSISQTIHVQESKKMRLILEDSKHYLLECDKFKHQREKMLKKLGDNQFKQKQYKSMQNHAMGKD